MKKTIGLYVFVLSFCVLFAPNVLAQTDAQFSQYYEIPTFYNPAAVGSTEYLRIRGGARLQWVGIDNAPRSFIGTADMPFKFGNKRVGFGIIANQESAGLYKSLSIGAQIGYKLRKLGGEWTVALQGGIYDQAFKGSEVFIPDDDDFHQSTDDAIPNTDIHGTAFDAAVGLWRKYQFQARRTLYFTAGSNIPIKNTLFEIMPSVLVKSDFSFTSGEINARVRYRKFLSAGIGYRWNDAVVVTLAAEIKNFFIGYSYDYSTSAIHKASSGSHELMAGYSLKIDLSEKNRHRHKSVRIM